jgi:transposase
MDEESQMELYCGIDLHSNNSYLSVIDEADRIVFERRTANDLALIVGLLAPYRGGLAGVAVESTYNWYWLVDGLQAAGYAVHLAKPAAMVPYRGLKHADDRSDARWLAHLLRLGILPEGYIYPAAERGLRDLLRKRHALVQQKTRALLAINTAVERTTGRPLGGNAIKRLEETAIATLDLPPDTSLAVRADVRVLRCLAAEIAVLEEAILPRVKLKPAYRGLLAAPGIGKVLGMTIALETGDIGRFARVGNFVSYCRCVEAKRESNGKRKGDGNAKSGNRWLAWAFIEAANFAVRYDERARRYYQRKKARRNGVVALKAVAHKLARACYYIMRDGTTFEPARCFG